MFRPPPFAFLALQSIAYVNPIIALPEQVSTSQAYGSLAQWLEQQTHNLSVAGSSPAGPTTTCGMQHATLSRKKLQIVVPASNSTCS